MIVWKWIKQHIQFHLWSSGEYYLGLAWEQDEWSLEFHLIKLILKLKGKPCLM